MIAGEKKTSLPSYVLEITGITDCGPASLDIKRMVLERLGIFWSESMRFIEFSYPGLVEKERAVNNKRLIKIFTNYYPGPDDPEVGGDSLFSWCPQTTDLEKALR